jgi:hypothetical protein
MKRRMLLITSSLLGALSGSTLFACGDYKGWEDTGDPETYSDYTGWSYSDIDQDGFYDHEDCDDSDAAINPDADEICDDDVDNDCDDLIDGDDDDCS